MPTNQTYSLQILFDGKQVTKEDFKEKAENAVQKYLENIELKIKSDHLDNYLLIIKGELSIVDECHKEIDKHLLQNSQLRGIRLLDEAGDEIRQQAYSILATIEQRFRVFINRCLIEVIGFEWGEIQAPPNIQNKVKQIRDQHNNKTFLDFLECTQFNDLIEIMEAEVSQYSEDTNLSIRDLNELLSDCTSISQLQDKLEQKTKKFSFWEVFSQYFENITQWKEVKSSLNFCINERHKVMHHRPIRLGVLKALEGKKEEIFSLLDSTKPELSEQERVVAKDYIQKTLLSFKSLEEHIVESTNIIKFMKTTAELPEIFSDLIIKVHDYGKYANFCPEKNNIDP